MRNVLRGAGKKNVVYGSQEFCVAVKEKPDNEKKGARVRKSKM